MFGQIFVANIVDFVVQFLSLLMKLIIFSRDYTYLLESKGCCLPTTDLLHRQSLTTGTNLPSSLVDVYDSLIQQCPHPDREGNGYATSRV